MDGLCDVLKDSDATFEFKAPGKMIKGLWISFQEMADADCHLILYDGGIDIKEVSMDKGMVMETWLEWTRLGSYNVNIPKGFEGIILRINFRSLVDLPNIGKDVYLTFKRAKGSPYVQVIAPNAPKADNQITIVPSAPSLVNIPETWKYRLSEPQAVEPCNEQVTTFQSKSNDELLMVVHPRGITLQKPKADGRKRGVIGDVPDPNSPFFDEDDKPFMEMMIPKSQIRAIHQLCRIGDTTLRFYINPNYDHIRIVVGIGSLCSVKIQIFGIPLNEEEDTE